MNINHDAELRYRTLFEQSPDGILIIDTNGRIIEFNDSAHQQLGYSRKEFAGLKLSDIDPVQTPEEIRASIKEVLNKGRAAFEVKHRTKDGEIRDVNVITQAIELSGRKVFHTIWRDITEQKRSEDALRNEKAFTEGALNTLKDIFFVFDLNGKFLRWNKTLNAVTGYSDEKVSSMKPVDFVPEEEAPRVMAAIGTVRRDGYASLETRVKTCDGREIPFEFSGSLLRDREGRVTGISGIGRDSTERKLVEKTLRDNENKFRNLSQEFHTLLDAISDSLLLIAPDLKVIWANKGTVSLFGKRISEIEGVYCYELLYNIPSPCEGCCVLKSFRTGRAESSQITLPGGRVCEARAFPIQDEEEGVKNVMLVISDVTEKITLQAEAMRVGHLASLGELAAGVAHEINNPVNGIINYAQILVNKTSKGSRENDIACRIIKEGGRISAIVKNLLSFARERQKERVPAHVHEILKDTLALTRTQLQKEGITLRLNVPADLPEVVVNPQQIQQVFLNIISNAHYALNQKYSGIHPDKTLRITGEKVIIDDRQYVRVAFYDLGIGIPPEIMSKIMNPFFSTKPGGMGTGLGLSISHGIISDHQGHIRIESVEKEFTKVIIDFQSRA